MLPVTAVGTRASPSGCTLGEVRAPIVLFILIRPLRHVPASGHALFVPHGWRRTSLGPSILIARPAPFDMGTAVR